MFPYNQKHSLYQEPGITTQIKLKHIFEMENLRKEIQVILKRVTGKLCD